MHVNHIHLFPKTVKSNVVGVFNTIML